MLTSISNLSKHIMNYNFLKSCTIVVIVSIFCVSTELRAQSKKKKLMLMRLSLVCINGKWELILLRY